MDMRIIGAISDNEPIRFSLVPGCKTVPTGSETDARPGKRSPPKDRNSMETHVEATFDRFALDCVVTSVAKAPAHPTLTKFDGIPSMVSPKEPARDKSKAKTQALTKSEIAEMPVAAA